MYCALLCCAQLLSHLWLFMTPWIIACQAPLSMGILLARVLEWVAMPSSSRGSSQPRDWTQVSHIAGRFFPVWATREAQEYCSRLSIPFPGDLPDPGIKPGSSAFQEDSLPVELQEKPWNSIPIQTIKSSGRVNWKIIQTYRISKKFSFHASFFRKLLKEFPPQELCKPRQGFPGDSLVKNPPAKAGDMGLVPGLGRSSGEGDGTPSSILAWEVPWQRSLEG